MSWATAKVPLTRKFPKLTWIDVDDFNIRPEYALNASPKDRREIKKIVYEHFDAIVDAWNEFQERKHGKAI